MLKTLFCIIGVLAVLFLVLLAGVVLTFCEIYLQAPDLYEAWIRRHEERKGKQ